MNIYLGPYLRCTPRTESITKTIHGCPNPACTTCAYGTSSLFCSLCGSKIGDVERVFEKEVPDTCAVSASIHEALTWRNSLDFSGDVNPGHLWLVNARRPGQPREYRVDGDAVVDLPGNSRGTDLTWFTAAFAAEIVVLRDAYNGGVKAGWGLIVSED